MTPSAGSSSAIGPEGAALILSLLRGELEAGALTDAGVALLIEQRLAGPAWVVWSRGDQSARADSRKRGERLEAAYRRSALAGTLLLERLDTVLHGLTERGVRALCFKGGGLLKAGLYADPGLRPLGDLDLLVRPEKAPEAVEILEEMGFVPWAAWHPERVQWADSLTLSRESPGLSDTVDLHWRTEFGRLRFGTGGSPLWCAAAWEQGIPDEAPHLLVVIEHILKHLRSGPHVLGLLDCLCLVPRVNWARFVGLARGRRTQTAVGIFLRALGEELGASVPEEVVRALVRPGDWGSLLERRVRPSRLLVTPPAGALVGVGRWALLSGSLTRAWRDLRDEALPDVRWLRARYGQGGLGRHRLRYLRDCMRWASGGGSPLV